MDWGDFPEGRSARIENHKILRVLRNTAWFCDISCNFGKNVENYENALRMEFTNPVKLWAFSDRNLHFSFILKF